QLIDHKKLAAFGGTAPFEKSSGGSSRIRRISRQADRQLKELLTTGVLSCIAPGRIYHQYYHHLLKKPGRKHLQAVNIIRNKLLKLAVTLIKKDQLFNKNIFLNNLNLPPLDLELA
ncbi:MAG: transposase, partial [Bacteroidota bacterium]